jgi:hypothetical protein
MKKQARTLLGSLSLLIVLLPLGCDDNKSDTAAPPAATASASAAVMAPSASAVTTDAPRTDRRGGGPATMLVRSARDLTLTDATKAKLDDIDAQLRANEGAARAELKALQSDIVEGIRAGKLDGAKLQSDYAAIDKATLARQAKESDALNALHGALDGAQRKALVDAVRAKQAARESQHAAHDDGDAGSAADWVSRRVERLTRQLALDPTQQKSVTAIVTKESANPAAMRAKHDEAKKQMDAALTAFVGDTFDATKTPLTPAGKTPHEGVQKDADFVSQLLPILTPDQRVKLATQRERGSNRRHGDGDDGRMDDDGEENGAAHNKE